MNEDDDIDVSFPFPFEPYGIQRQFMARVFATLEAGNVGIFESPTGTGKSQSILNSVLLWLKRYAPPLEEDEDAAAVAASASAACAPSSSSWIDDFDPTVAERAQRKKRQAARKIKLERRLRRLRGRQRSGRGLYRRTTLDGEDEEDAEGGGFFRARDCKRARKRARTAAADCGGGGGAAAGDSDAAASDDAFLVTDAAASTATKAKRAQREAGDTSDTTDSSSEEDLVSAGDSAARVRKVIYCSRTHSQLSQFVAELRKTVFCGDSSSASGGGVDDLSVRVACLASRSQLCVNDAVRLDKSGRQRSAGAINERCLKLARDGPCCSALGKKGAPNGGVRGSQVGRGGGVLGGGGSERAKKLNKIRDHALVRIRDIEELATLGRSLNSCACVGVLYCFVCVLVAASRAATLTNVALFSAPPPLYSLSLFSCRLARARLPSPFMRTLSTLPRCLVASTDTTASASSSRTSVRCLLCTVTFHAKHAHSLTHSP